MKSHTIGLAESTKTTTKNSKSKALEKKMHTNWAHHHYSGMRSNAVDQNQDRISHKTIFRFVIRICTQRVSDHQRPGQDYIKTRQRVSKACVP